MDTLISLGTLAAWGWSVVALFFLDAGATGMKMPFELLPSRGCSTSQIYLEVAAVVVDVPARRPLLRGAREAPRRRRAARARRARCEGRRDPRRGRRRAARSDRASSRSATCSSCGPGEKVADRRGRRRGQLGGRPVAADRRERPGRGRRRATRWPARRSTSAAGSSSRRGVSAPRPRSRRSHGSSTEAQTGQGAGTAARRPRLGRSSFPS